MRERLLEEMRGFADSTRPVSEMDDWWKARAAAVENVLGRFAFLSITKRKFFGLKQVLSREGVLFSEAPGYCKECGEKMFVSDPRSTTPEQIVSFAETYQSASASQIARTGWIHPGMYCKNGCMIVLWNFGPMK
jgi:hypothetical protein